MSRAIPLSLKKRKLEHGMVGKAQRPRKRIREQQEYHSSSEDESSANEGASFTPVDLNDSDDASVVQRPTKPDQPVTPVGAQDQSDQSDQSFEGGSDASNDESGSDTSNHHDEASVTRKSSKRNNPEAFSTSITKILSAKLPKAARGDPVLSRSKDAAVRSQDLANERLEFRVRAKLRAEKQEELQKGRIKDVLGIADGQSGEVAEEEKRLRKIAQRGVVKLFNAVRAAQVRGEQAMREERKKGTIGSQHREEKVQEMSKQGFLDLISGKPDSTTGDG